MMKLLRILGLALLLLAVQSVRSQPSAPAAQPDSSQYPYWIQMMQDPSANFFSTLSAFNKYWEHRTITRGCGWKPFKRWESYMQQRVSPTGEIPAPDHVQKTYAEYMQKHDQSNSLAGTWVSQGPASLPSDKGYKGLGRINTIGFHPTDPNTLYVGTPAGGLWVTTIGGNNWTTNTDMLPTLGVSAIVTDPLSPSTIYIGTGDRDAGDAPGLGVMKSTDNGLSWTTTNTGMGNATVGKMLINPSNTLILFAATTSGIYKSTDGAASWTKKIGGGFKDICFRPGSTDILYATQSGKFYRSTDAGETWYQISAGIPTGARGVIGVSPANPMYVYFLLAQSDNSFKGLYRSTDGGLTFTERSNSPNIMGWGCDGSDAGGQAWYDLALAVDPVNPEIIYTGGVDVWKSTNGGTSWFINAHWYGGCSVPAVHADQHYFAFNPVNNRLYIGNDGGIYWTDNGGSAWHEISDGLTISQAYKLGQSATVDELVTNGYQDNGSSLYDNGTWYSIGGGDGMECAIDFVDPMYRYTTVYYGSINRTYGTTGQGTIAANGVNGITEEGAWVTPFILDAKDPNTMFIGYKNVWRSNNVKAASTGSVKWKIISDINTPNLDVLKESPVNTNILYASNSGNLYISNNAQTDPVTWLNISGNLPSSTAISSIETSPFDENTVYITQNNKIFKSTNKGTTWTDISGTFPNIHISSIVYYKNSQEGLYLGTDAGVFYKDNSMADWIPFKTGLPANARVTELEIYYDSVTTAGDRIKAATYGRGMWKSDMYFTTPTADFIADPLLIPYGCSVNFRDLSSGVPSEWHWSFPGGNPATSNVKNPKNIVYDTPGLYNVQLISGNSAGSDTLVKTAYIIVSDTVHPIAGFYASPRIFCNSNQVVSLTDTSKYCPYAWMWTITPNTFNFLNGTGINSQNPQVIFTQNGMYSVTLTAINANGISSVSKQDYIVVGGYTLPFTENFESADFDTKGWTVENPDNLITWDIAQVAGNSPGNHAARMDFFDYAVPPGRRDRLISPSFDFTGLSNVSLSFQHAYATRYTSYSDSLILYVSEDCGVSWERIFGAGEKGQGTFATVPKMTTAFIPAIPDDWCGGGWGSACYIIDLSNYANKQGIKLAFEGYNRFGNNLYIDNISVSPTTGIAPYVSDKQGIMVYPNPTIGMLSVISGKPVEKLTLSVYNPEGQKVLSRQTEAASNLNTSLNLRNLPKGVYTLRITGARTLQSEKVVLE